jgi:hypothetical protein
VGTLDGTHAFVAVLLGARGSMRAYVSDSTHGIAAFFVPASVHTRHEAANAGVGSAGTTSREGVRLEATIARGNVSGSVVLSPGVRHRFRAVRVALPGSFYEIEIGRGVTRYLGGWIVWERGWTLGYLDPAPVVRLRRHAARAESRG